MVQFLGEEGTALGLANGWDAIQWLSRQLSRREDRWFAGVFWTRHCISKVHGMCGFHESSAPPAPQLAPVRRWHLWYRERPRTLARTYSAVVSAITRSARARIK